MKNFKSLFVVVCALLMSLPFAACDKPLPEPEPEPEPVNMPSVTVTAGAADETTLSFTVTPEDADRCAWICLESGRKFPTAESILSTAEAILSNTENAVSATDATTVEVSGLTPNTEYVILAAVGSGEIAIMSEPVYMKTLDEEGLRFQEAIADVYDGGSIVTFVEESGTYQLSFFFHYAGDAKYLPAGTYTIGGNSATPGTIDGDVDYTQLRLLKENRIVAIDGGTVNVSVSENGTYNIVAEFTTAVGEFKTLFTGDIEGFNLSYTFVATSAKYLGVPDGVPGEFRIRLNDANWGCSLMLDIFADSGANTLPAGTYTVSAGTAAGSIGQDSYIDIFSSNKRRETFAAGTVEVNITNFIYTLDIKLENADGFKINGTFTGKITEAEYVEIVMESAVATTSSGSLSSTRESGLKFSKGEDQLCLATIYDVNSKYLPAGTYIVRNSEAAGTIDNANYDYTYFYHNEELLELISGTMTVGLDVATEVYDITVEFMTARGDFRVSYKGKIEGFRFSYDLSALSSAIRMKPDGEVSGEYFIKIEDAPKAFEIHLDFFADPASKTLPEGIYTVGTGTNQGSIGPESFLNIKYPANTVDKFASGTVTVAKKDEVYTFDINLFNADGYRMAGTFTGKIVGMEREEDTDRIAIDCTYIKRGADCDQSKGHALWLMGNTLGDSMSIEMYNDGSILLPAGTYIVGEGTTAGTIVGSSDFTYLRTKVYGASQKLKISEGTLTVAIDGEIYKIKFDFTANNGDKFRAKYEGSVPENFTW